MEPEGKVPDALKEDSDRSKEQNNLRAKFRRKRGKLGMVHLISFISPKKVMIDRENQPFKGGKNGGGRIKKPC